MASPSSAIDGDLRASAMKLFGNDPIPLINLINHLFSEDATAQRSDAETLYSYCKIHYVNSITRQLLTLIIKSPVATTRTRCATLLLRLFSAPNRPVLLLNPVIRNDVKSGLLSRLRIKTKDQETLVRVCAVVSEIAGDLLPKNQWDELFHFMFECLSSIGCHRKHGALLLFSELIPKCPELFSPLVDSLHVEFCAIMDQSWEEHWVTAAAARAAVEFILHLTTPASYEKYYDLLAYMIKLLFELNDEAEYAQSILESLVVLAGVKTEFLRVNIPHLLLSMLKLARDGVLAEKTRQLAVEFVITVAEDRESGCGMIQSASGHIKRLLYVLLEWLADIKDVEKPSWDDADSDDQNEGESSLCFYAMESMSRLAIALGGHAILPNFPENMEEFLKASEWKKRHAAVTALGLISEGCSKVMVNYLDKLVDTVLQLIRDLHPRGRWAAIRAVGQFSKNLCPLLQEKYHQKLVPALIAALDDIDNPRVQTQAASAMLLFSWNCNSNILKPYLNKIVSKLLMFLQRGKKMLKEAVFAALATLAYSSKEDFAEYYDSVMSYVKVFFVTILENPDRMLVAKSLECSTMVGLAVGRSKFRDDAQEVAEVLIMLQEQHMETADPVRTHSLQAWGRLCKCLGSEFLPYLSFIIPHLLHCANASLTEDEENDEDPDNEREQEDCIMEIYPLFILFHLKASDFFLSHQSLPVQRSVSELTAADRMFGIRDHILEEKALACNILCSIAAELKEEMHLWIHEIVVTLVPLISFKFHEGVRTAAVSAMPLMLQSAVSAANKGFPLPGFRKSPVKTSFKSIVDGLLDGLQKEVNMGVRERIVEALNECIQISGSRLSKSEVTKFIGSIKEILPASSYRKNEREKRVKKCLDMRQLESLQEESEQEKEVCRKVADCLGTFIRALNASFLPFFDEILPCIALMWGNNKRAEERKIVLRIFHDVAEQCGEEAFRYYETTLPYLFKACKDENPDVRQVVACAIGVCAEFGGKAFEPHFEVALDSLKAIIEHPSASEPDNMPAYEAAVSALGKICQFHDAQAKTFKVIPLWLHHLPIRYDLVEAKRVHDQLSSMIERSKNRVVGSRGKNIPRIVKIFAEILWAGHNLATEETTGRMINLLKQLHSNLQMSQRESIYSLLPLQQQNMLHSILLS